MILDLIRSFTVHYRIDKAMNNKVLTTILITTVVTIVSTVVANIIMLEYKRQREVDQTKS